MKKALGILAVSAFWATVSQASQVTLSITSPSPGNWQAWAQVSADCRGIASFIMNVTGDNGLTMGTSTNMSPRYYDPGLQAQVGFRYQRLNGTGGVGIQAGQNTTYGPWHDPDQDALVIQNVGILPGSFGSTSWTAPVLVGQGTYTGTVGTLHACVGNGQFNLLKSVAGGPWSGPGNVSKATSVIPADFSAKPNPEFYAAIIAGKDGVANATAIRNVLLQQPGVKSENVKLVTDPLEYETEVGGLLEKTKKGDRFLLYAVGHGGYDDSDHSEPFVGHSPLMALLDFPNVGNDGDEEFVFDSDTVVRYVSDDSLTQFLGLYPDVAKTVIMDTCFAGGFLGQSGNQSDVGDLDKIANTALIAACPEGYLSFGSKFSGRSFFSLAVEKAFLLGTNGFAGADDNLDHVVSTAELADYLSDNYGLSQIFNEFGLNTGIIFGYPGYGNDTEYEMDAVQAAMAWSSDYDPDAGIVPEPASLGLLAIGGLALIHRRRK